MSVNTLDKDKLIDPNIALIKSRIRSICPGSRIILFGSRAKGNAIPYSDYDIMIVVREKISMNGGITI